MDFLKTIIKVVKNSFNLIGYLLRLIIKYPTQTKLIKKSGGGLFILANGPSLKNDIPEIKKNKGKVEFMVMNYMALEDVFYELKPKHYCFIDPMFFIDTHRKDEAKKLFKVIREKVDWNITIYLPYNFAKYFYNFSNLINKNIEIVVVNNCKYSGFEKFRNYFYKWGFSCPELYSVITMATYIGIKSKYDYLKLYGVDHTFFDNIQINHKNQLSAVYNHFYQEEDVKLKPIKRIHNGEVWRISDYVLEKGLLFKSHDYLNSFANVMDVPVINCTENSLIDSYNRKL